MFGSQYFIIILFIHSIQSQSYRKCESFEKCNECMQQINCIWCITPINKNTTVHCLDRSQNAPTLCPDEDAIDPHSKSEILENREFSDDEDRVVQIRPQHAQIALRKDEEIQIKFQFRHAKNYPIDLYYLMDLSQSMVAHRDRLGELGDKLAETMLNITSNFRVGFGSFVDKVVMPYSSIVPESLKSPCEYREKGEKKPCAPGYSYKNHMSLSSNWKMFSQNVLSTVPSGNLDSPESGFEALMQAMTCDKIVGWRPNARRLIIFSTDQQSHIAGDGKLGGIIEPNDGKCHMTDNEYREYLNYDYPSISHIDYVAKENNINIIFAIVSKDSTIYNVYENISKLIENSNIGKLGSDSNNVVTLVLDNYNKIANDVTMIYDKPDGVDVRITSSCAEQQKNGCSGVGVSETVDFTATLRLVDCPPTNADDSIGVIQIRPQGLNEKFVIDVRALCQCNCTAAPATASAANCSGNGVLECGVCSCNAGAFGRQCECNATSSGIGSIEDCRATPSDPICSGLGNCVCGQCQCIVRDNVDEKIEGHYCECDNFSCKRKSGILCAGNGKCDCGRCQCRAGWTGDDCACALGEAQCQPPDPDKPVCNGRGDCVCGRCECRKDEQQYLGQYCEECVSCPAQRCNELQNCVECQAYKTGFYDKNACITNCTLFQTKIVEKIDEDNIDNGVKLCKAPDAVNCFYKFHYSYDDDKNLIVVAEKKKICNNPLNVLAWIFGVAGSIVLAGLILLIIWKIYVEIHDRREYTKFENEKKNMKWHNNDNPLYRQAVSSFSNPVYRRGSKRCSVRQKPE